MELTHGYGAPDLGRMLRGHATRDPSNARIEAEDMEIVQGFSVATSGVASSGAWLQGGAAGAECIARLVHVLGEATFNITVSHFDESDGQSSSAVYRNGTLLDSWVWNVDADLATGNATAASRVDRTIPNVVLADGDVIELRGTPHASEAMRIDYLDFALI